MNTTNFEHIVNEYTTKVNNLINHGTMPYAANDAEQNLPYLMVAYLYYKLAAQATQYKGWDPSTAKAITNGLIYSALTDIQIDLYSEPDELETPQPTDNFLILNTDDYTIAYDIDFLVNDLEACEYIKVTFLNSNYYLIFD